MAITCKWRVDNMTRNEADGGVILVYWSCVAGNVTGTDADGENTYDYTATESGKLRCEPDPSAPGYIPFADLTEADVLGWVYSSLVEGDETPDEAKARIEENRTAKVQGQIDRASSTATGLPW